MPVGDGDDARLDGRQPYREIAREVLDEDGDEALEGSVDGAVDHHRAMERVVLAHVLEIEALRSRVVELDGAELPESADAVLHLEIELGSVEGAVARVLHPGHGGLLDGGLEARLGTIPHGVVPEPLGGTSTELGDELEPEGIVD